MRESTCCFSGHRTIEFTELPKVKVRLREAVEYLIDIGVTRFIAGGALGFDMLAAQTVLDLKKEYPQIALILAIPCPDQTKGWPAQEMAEYERIRALADEVTVLAPRYHRGCMLRRNDWMIDHSAYLICYRKHTTGGTAYTVRRATEGKLHIRNLANPNFL